MPGAIGNRTAGRVCAHRMEGQGSRAHRLSRGAPPGAPKERAIDELWADVEPARASFLFNKSAASSAPVARGTQDSRIYIERMGDAAYRLEERRGGSTLGVRAIDPRGRADRQDPADAINRFRHALDLFRGGVLRRRVLPMAGAGSVSGSGPCSWKRAAGSRICSRKPESTIRSLAVLDRAIRARRRSFRRDTLGTPEEVYGERCPAHRGLSTLRLPVRLGHTPHEPVNRFETCKSSEEQEQASPSRQILEVRGLLDGSSSR